MGTQLLVSSTDFLPDCPKVRLPGTLNDGLDGLFIFLAGLDYATKNYADPDAAPASIVGSPVEGDGFISFHAHNDYLLTSIPEATEMTLAAIYRSTDTSASSAHTPMIVANYNGSGAMGTNLYPATGTTAGGNASYNLTAGGNTGASAFPADTPTDWGARYVRAANTVLTGGNLTNSAKTVNNVSGASSRHISSGNMMIGSSYSASFLGTSDILAAMIWSRALTDTELTTMLYPWMQLAGQNASTPIVV